MNEKIRAYVAKYNASKARGTDDESIIDTIMEANYIWSGDESDRRWWTDCFTVVEVDGMLIGFADAKTTGDYSPSDK